MQRADSMALFVAAVDTGSLSAAARQHGLSLSSVSRHLTALEERVGTRLIVRSTRMLSLTEAGHFYYEKSKRLLAEIEEMEACLTTNAADPVGHLVIYGPTLFGRVYLLPLLGKFLVKYPKVSIDVKLLDRPIRMIEEGIDVAVQIGPPQDSSYIARKIGCLRWVVAASPTYLSERGEPKTLDELIYHDCLVFNPQGRHDYIIASTRGHSSEWCFLDASGRRVELKVHARMHSNTIDGVILAAVEGAGLVCAPLWSVANHVAQGKLCLILQTYELPPLDIYAIFTHNRLLAGKVRALVDFLVEHLSNIDFNTLT